MIEAFEPETANVLAISSMAAGERDTICGELFEAADDPDGLLGVTALRTPDELLDVWRTHVDVELPSRGGIVTLNDHPRSVAADRATIDQGVPIPIACPADPGDLSQLGIEIARLLPEQAEGATELVGCFDSLTVLLEHADVQSVFRFLHVLTGKVAAHDAVVHYHLDPTAHEDETITTLEPLFDAVVRYSAADGWTLEK